MKTVSKKLLSLLLVVLLLAAAVPFQAFAEDYTLTITVVDGGAEKGTGTIDVASDAEVTKSQIDAKVAEILGTSYPNGYTIISYTSTAGAEFVAADSTLTSGARTLTVGVQTNEVTPAQDTRSLVLDAGEGTIGTSSASTQTITVNKDADNKYKVGSLPEAHLSGYDFIGWFIDTTTEVRNGYELTEATVTAHAKYAPQTKNILVKGVKTTQKAEEAQIISQYNAPVGQSLISFLTTPTTDPAVDVQADVRASVPKGYQLKTNNGSILWYNFSGSQELTTQDAVTSVAQTVLVKYEPKSYKLVFDANGGTVSPGEKTVTFDAKVGTLPTPTQSPSRKDNVFLGWFAKDENGKEVEYTADTVYKVDGNTTLTAKWGSEATVLLRIYLDPNTTTADRIVDITGKVVGNSVTQSEVEKIVTTYYSAESGKEMKLVGLFTDATWAEYKAGTVTTGDPNVTVQETAKTNVYVVVKNAANKPNSTNPSTSTTSTTAATTKPADKDNPKTGDSMMIYTASAVMVLAAAALVVVQIVRKKRTF